MAFSFGNGGFGDIVSDQFSFLDQDADSLQAKGDGGVRQMHNYVHLGYVDTISNVPEDNNPKGSNKISQDLTIEQLQQQREAEYQNIAKRNTSGAF